MRARKNSYTGNRRSTKSHHKQDYLDNLQEDHFVGRVILSATHRRYRYNSLLCGECNGVVFDARTWEFLVIPPRAFNFQFKHCVVDDALAAGHYDIIPVDDGTVITLYQWNEPGKGLTWCLSSANGYDLSSLLWMGPNTYTEIFYKAGICYKEFANPETGTGMSLLQIDKRFRLSFQKLDPTYCYTVGFRHHDFHPLIADPPRMWQIQCANLKTGKIEYEFEGEIGLKGIPRQKILSAEEKKELLNKYTKNSSVKIVANLTYQSFLQLVKTAYGDAVHELHTVNANIQENDIDGHPPTPASSEDKPQTQVARKFNYGYILRSRNPGKTGCCSDILIESSLFKWIRKLIYEQHSASPLVREELNNLNRLEYSAIRAYLDENNRKMFISLFTQFQTKYLNYGEFIRTLISQIREKMRTARLEYNNTSPPSTLIGQLAQEMCDDILEQKQNRNLAVFVKDIESKIEDYVMNPEAAMLYLKVLHDKGEQKILND